MKCKEYYKEVAKVKRMNRLAYLELPMGQIPPLQRFGGSGMKALVLA